MKKIGIIILILLVVIVFYAAGCNKPVESSKELIVYVWDGYLPERVIEQFEEESGIKLRANLISDNAATFNLLKSGGKADLVMPTQNQVNRFYVENLAIPLDLDKLENYKNVSESFKDQDWSMWDGKNLGSGDTYAIPYIFGTSGLVINTNKYAQSIEGMGWEVLFEPELKSRVSSRNSAESLMICMDLLGIPRSELMTNPEATLERIKGKAIELRNNVLKFYNTGAEVLDLLKNEEIWVAHIWDGGARKLAASDPKFKYVLPASGGFGWTDTFMIPSSAANAEGAYEFIDFMLKPDIAAIVLEDGGFTTTVKGSIDLAEGIDKELYVFTPEELSSLKWQLNYPQEVVDAYISFWEELSTIE